MRRDDVCRYSDEVSSSSFAEDKKLSLSYSPAKEDKKEIVTTSGELSWYDKEKDELRRSRSQIHSSDY